MENKYYEYEPNKSQYDDCEFNDGKIVHARYIKPMLDCDIGNPYIEALPHPRSEADVQKAYTKHLLTYNYDATRQMSKAEKMLQVSTLRQLRFPLTFHKNLEFSFYNALLTSYRSRKPRILDTARLGYVTEDFEQETSCVLYGDSADSTNAGFSLIGYSGCGKSSAIQTLLSYYPQTIIHRVDRFTQYVQIVYLVVNCVPNSNFSALYESIGEAIDKALNNVRPTYAAEIAKTRTLGKKLEKVKELIELFGIGMIIFDEIQLIDFDRTKESSFESLMTLSNRTKVAIAVVGTEDARDKMFKELRTARRVGVVINGNMYCENKKFFSYLVSCLFQYQWFDEPVKLNKDIIDALYDVTKGIVDQLIGIYSCMHYDYLERNNRPTINSAYIYEITHKYYPGMQNVLENMEANEATRKFADIRQTAEVRIASMLDNAKQEKEANTILENNEGENNRVFLLRRVVSLVTMLYDEFSISDIEKAFDSIMKKNKDETISEQKLARLVIDELNKKKNKTVKSKKKNFPDVDTSKVRDYIGE